MRKQRNSLGVDTRWYELNKEEMDKLNTLVTNTVNRSIKKENLPQPRSFILVNSQYMVQGNFTMCVVSMYVNEEYFTGYGIAKRNPSCDRNNVMTARGHSTNRAVRHCLAQWQELYGKGLGQYSYNPNLSYTEPLVNIEMSEMLGVPEEVGHGSRYQPEF